MKINWSKERIEEIERERTLEEVIEYIKRLPKTTVGTSRSLIRESRDSN